MTVDFSNQPGLVGVMIDGKIASRTHPHCLWFGGFPRHFKTQFAARFIAVHTNPAALQWQRFPAEDCTAGF